MKTKLSERELVQWDLELVIRTTFLLYLQLIQDYTSFIKRKLVPGRRVTPLPELPWTSFLFLHFLTKLGEPFTLESKNLVRLEQVTYLAGFPFFDCRVTLLAGPTFRDKNSLAHPAGSTQSKRDNQCVHEHFFKLLAWAKVTLFSHINTHKGWFSWEGDPFLPGQLFSI